MSNTVKQSNQWYDVRSKKQLNHRGQLSSWAFRPARTVTKSAKHGVNGAEYLHGGINSTVSSSKHDSCDDLG